MKRLVLIGLLLSLTVFCRGEIVITEANCTKPIDITENVFYYDDPTGEMTFETAASEKFFRNYIQMPSNILTIGGDHNTTWVLITLKNTTARRQDFFLSLQNPNIDELVFCSMRDTTFFNTGLNYPFSQRPSDSKFYNFTISVVPRGQATYCIKFSPQTHVVQIPIVLKPGQAFFDEGNFDHTMNGLAYAIAMLTILAMTLLYISEKEKIYIVSMLLLVSLFVLMLHYDLTIYKFLLPHSPSANKIFGKLLKPLTLTAFIYYQKYCMPPRPIKRLRANPSNLMISFGFLCTFLSFFSFAYAFRAFVLNAFITLTFVYLVYCIVSNWSKKNLDFALQVLVSGTIFISLIYKNIITSENWMFVYTNEHYVKIALLTLSAQSLIRFSLKFVKTRTEYYEMNRNMEDSIKKRTELINQQKEVLNQQREELIQQKDALQSQREELRAQKELLQMKNNELGKISQVTNRSNNRIVIFNPNGDIDWFNAAFGKLIGTDYEEYQNGPAMNIIEMSSNADNIKKALSTCVEKKEPVSYELMEKNDDGNANWSQVTLTPIVDDDGKVSRIIAVGSNISKLKEYERKIEQQNAEVEAQRDFAIHQKDELEAKQSEIYGSIRYAKRIQTAMLPKPKQLQRDFSDSFILYMPKDIVSGDFYWYHRIDNKYFIAAVDCTGHGVPGAFLSIIGSYLLNSIVIYNGVFRPANILKHLNRKIKIALKTDDIREQNNDGMDISIAVIDKEKHIIEYAGALRPMYLYSNKEFVELKGDKIPITSNLTGTTSTNNTYTNYEYPFNPGDQFYIFSDGIIDQFGGDDGKKYLTKRFKALLDTIKDRPMSEQKELIKKDHDEWRGHYDQVDDILVIGVRYSSQDL